MLDLVARRTRYFQSQGGRILTDALLLPDQRFAAVPGGLPGYPTF